MRNNESTLLLFDKKQMLTFTVFCNKKYPFIFQCFIDTSQTLGMVKKYGLTKLKRKRLCIFRYMTIFRYTFCLQFHTYLKYSNYEFIIISVWWLSEKIRYTLQKCQEEIFSVIKYKCEYLQPFDLISLNHSL